MTGLQAVRVPALSLAQTQTCVTGWGLAGLGITPGETFQFASPRQKILSCLLQPGPISFGLIPKFLANCLERGRRSRPLL